MRLGTETAEAPRLMVPNLISANERERLDAVRRWVVTDATVDPRTLANPLVVGELGLRFYVGVPLTTREGYNLGTLNVIDTEPREVTSAEIATLEDLAAIVIDEMELRLAARREEQRLELLDPSRGHGLAPVAHAACGRLRSSNDAAAE